MDWLLHICDVCRLLDGNHRQKMCFYCPVCDAWICEDDQHNWSRRGAASAKAIAERIGVRVN
jgi:hypothetical protein